MSENLFTLLEDRIRRSRDDRFLRKAAVYIRKQYLVTDKE
jgi:hypothetical protein